MKQLDLSFSAPLPLLQLDEIYGQANQQLLWDLAEDRRLERKPPGIHARALADYFSMWSNTAPDGGLIVVGLEDGGHAAGCHTLSHEKLNELEKSHADFCPDAKVQSRRVAVETPAGISSFVVLFRIYYREDKVVFTNSGAAFARVGDTKRQLRPEEIRELQIDKGQLAFEQERVALRFPEDFDRDLIAAFASEVRAVRALHQKHSDEEILLHRRLGRMKDGNFIPNTACALLFARDPLVEFPGCKVRFLRIDGEYEKSGEQYNVVKDIPIEGPIPLIISETEKVLESQLREYSRLGKDGRFYSAPEYPKPAWYEAIVNACVHRSYGIRNMNVFVKMFDDKLVVESPGGFPPLVTPENIYESHHPRNPCIMDAMFYLRLVKAHNEGTRRMRDTMREMQLPLPEFRQTEGGGGYSLVRVTLKNNRKQRREWIDVDITKRLGEALIHDLNEEERRILNHVAEHSWINVSQCHRLVSSSAKWHSAKKILDGLVSRELLTRIQKRDRDPKSRYVLADSLSPKGGGQSDA
jgi:ATP-dependent DNA helicase RecG